MHIISHQAGQFVAQRSGLDLFPSCQVNQVPFVVRSEIGAIEPDRLLREMLRLFQVSQFPQERSFEIAGLIIPGIAHK